MALYHFQLGHIGRNKGHTAIAAAYRAGEKLVDDFYGEMQDYTRKGGVMKTEILAPDYVPERLCDRQTLWNEVEKNERRKDAQLVYSFDIALQNELHEGSAVRCMEARGIATEKGTFNRWARQTNFKQMTEACAYLPLTPTKSISRPLNCRRRYFSRGRKRSFNRRTARNATSLTRHGGCL